jgi:hypothetical protein
MALADWLNCQYDRLQLRYEYIATYWVWQAVLDKKLSLKEGTLKGRTPTLQCDSVLSNRLDGLVWDHSLAAF